ncbi:MAG TPA: GlsB/YeaQ/YmgE family stress response membrane protein [Acidimicrobiales bacterium]
MWSLIMFLVLGLVAGWLARLLVPGEDPMKIHQTLALGVVGSYVGGFLGKVIFDVGDSWLQSSNIIGSVLGAVLVLMIFNALEGEKSRNKSKSKN